MLSGIAKLFYCFIQRNKVTVLLFHDIDKENAENSFSYLSEKYNIISLTDFVKANIQKDLKKLPKWPLIITFDDGHISNHDILPVIKKYNIPITVFLCSDIINTNRHFWFNHKNIPLKELKNKSNSNRLKILSEFGFQEDKEFETPQALSGQQIREMNQYVDFQSHTRFHPCLPKCNDKEAFNEIVNSKINLENEYGFKINAIAYPNGDYSERDIKIAKNNHYECGLTVDYGYNSVKTDLFRMKRINVNKTHNLYELIAKSTGAWSFFKTMNGRKQSYGFDSFIR